MLVCGKSFFFILFLCEFGKIEMRLRELSANIILEKQMMIWCEVMMVMMMSSGICRTNYVEYGFGYT